jgi:hydroxymethylglutaryl-CoA reductase
MLKLSNQADIAFSYAPGKIILVGEHAVVYGAQAIAMPIDAGIRVAISRLNPQQAAFGPLLRGVGPFFMGDVTIGPTSSGPQILIAALAYLVDAFGPSLKEIAIMVDATLPPGRGLGSSASLSVALIRGLYRYFSWPLKDKDLQHHALALETIFHGSPSGIDHTVIMGEQVIGFKRSEEGPIVWPITLKSPCKLVIGLIGPHDGTKNAVKELRERKKRHMAAYQRIFDGLNEIAEEMERALIEGQQACVGELMNIAQGYLNALSLSTPEIEKLCAIAKERGALGAKLTGAGGGGAVIALADGNEEDIAKAFRAAGYQSLVTTALERT